MTLLLCTAAVAVSFAYKYRTEEMFSLKSSEYDKIICFKKGDGKMKDQEKNYTWKLEDIYADEEKWEQDFKKAEALLSEVAAYQGRLGESAETLLKALKASEQLQMLNEKLFTYACMRQDEDNTNAKYQALKDRAAGLSTKVSTAVSFMVPEILSLPTETLNEFRQQPGFKDYQFFLEELIRQKPHTLSESEEQLLAQVGDVTQGPDNIFRMVNIADMKFPTIKNEQGEDVEITHGNYQTLMMSFDRRVRKDAFTSLYSSYRARQNTLATTLSTAVKRDVFYARARKHSSALDAALFADNISTEVYDNLIKTVRANLDDLHRYVALRKKLLGVDELHMYDLYVPLVKDVQWKVEYPEAVEMVKQGLQPLGKEYIENLTAGFNSGWVDVYHRKGKTSGAYSWGPYGVHPYVLLNYDNNLNDVFTLAHEMGHAMHSYYSYREQPYINAHYSIFTAEVASTLNELMLMDYLLKKITDPDKKLYLINHYLETIRGTVYRQTMFAEFEKIIHEKIEAGEALTAESLSAVYRQLNVDYYGPEIVVDKDIDLEWSRIPHFYNAFYVYKYATGLSAAAALKNQIIEQGQPAVDRYISFLKSGGSDYPLNLLKSAGVDMTSPEPVQVALDLFAELLNELEKTAAQK